MFKTILKLFFLLAILVGIVFTITRSQKRICNDIDVSIEYNGENIPITEEEIVDRILKEKIVTDSIKIKDVDFSRITELLSQIVFIKDINYIAFVGNTLSINITLHDIIMHVFPDGADDFFVSTEGIMLPSEQCIKEKLIIVNGTIPSRFSDSSANHLIDTSLIPIFNIAQKIVADTFCKAQFQQIHVNNNHEIELISTVGTQIFLLGDADLIDEKLFEIQELYKKGGFAYGNSIPYSYFDVRYKNRIIAKK